MRKWLFMLIVCHALAAAHAQMWNGIDTLYGNEWIDYSKSYYKIPVAADGIYRISYQILAQAGLPMSQIDGQTFVLYRYGRQEPLYCSTSGVFGPQDFMEFYGEKNRGQVDSFLFEQPAAEQINPRYSLFNDTAVYYLTWDGNGGKRISAQSSAPLSPPLNPLPYCYATVEQLFTIGIFKKKISDEITYSWFDGVGFTTAGSASETPVLFDLPGFIPAASPARAHVRYAGNLGYHDKKVLLNDSLYAEDQFYDYQLIDRVFDIPSGELNNTGNRLHITSPVGDRHGLAVFDLRYTRNFDCGGSDVFSFSLLPSTEAQYIEFQSFNAGGVAPVLYDLNHDQRFETILDNGLVKIKLPPSATERRLLLVREGGQWQTPAPAPVTFKDLSTPAADYLIISHRALRYDPFNGSDPVADYAAYRAGAAGGSHQVKVVDIEDIYAQFAYGVRFHPIAVRNFLHWAHRRWPQAKHVLLIGKALDFQGFRSSAQQSALADSLFFIPNFSLPGADLPFVMEGNRLGTPIMAIGRLAVTRPGEIRDYLVKVKQHEQALLFAGQNIAGKAWMKRVIHNSGGLSGESTAIRNFVGSMGAVLSNNRFGADIRTFYKTSDDPIQLSAYEQLLNLVNDGVSIWTIFGHSSAFAVDFDIGLPSDYQNAGKYPLLMVLGCFSGACSAPQPGIGEQFVLAPQRGAIAYIASVNYSYVGALHDYGRQFYQRIGGLDYGQSLGQALIHTVADLKGNNSPGLIAVLHQNLLQGDPAIRLHTHNGPDYTIDPQSVVFQPNPANLQEENLQLSFDVVNLGENVPNDVALQIKQRLPGASNALLRLYDTIPAPAFKNHLQYTLPTAGSVQGFNRFYVDLDPNQEIDENPPAAENNNALLDGMGTPGKDLYFYSDDIAPMYPADFGIVGQKSIVLYASTLNGAAPAYRYLWELDTLETFDSPFKTQAQLLQPGGLLAWTPSVTLADSTVYYWRVARDSLVDGAPLWRTRSFLFLDGQLSGWNQSHFGQYAQNNFANLKADSTQRSVSFFDNAAFINVQVAYRGVNAYPGFKNAYYQGFYGDYGFGQQGIDRGVAMMVVDKNSGKARINAADGPFNYVPKKDREFFWFDTRDSLERLKMMAFIASIPDGDYVGLLALNKPDDATGYAPWRWAADSVGQGKNLFQVLEAQGAQKVRNLALYQPVAPAYGLVFQKNNPTYPARDTIVADPSSTVSLRADFSAKWSVGLMETPVVGPVKRWKSLHWRHESFDDPSDKATLSVLAVREGLPDTLLLTLENSFDTSLDLVSAAQFPLLRLRYDLLDTALRSATPLRFARLQYDALPEGAIAPAQYFHFYSDTLQRGDTLKVGLAFTNISGVAFDSLLVRFQVENQDNNGFQWQQLFPGLEPGALLQYDAIAPTRSINGNQRLNIEFNPIGNQTELSHANNTYTRNFYVQKDEANPVLDVTFDGRHILHGEMVSPAPVVVVTLKDENRYLALRDSSTFYVRLTDPEGQVRLLTSGDPDVQFFIADLTQLPRKNQARLEWRPTFVKDGIYRLEVNGKDATDNESADLDWAVDFQILTKSSLSHLLNYPNPFSTQTCFYYTLTGAESPAHFKIQIMTVAGRVVREITEQEFGPLLPGVHRSDFCWDGKDEFGDPLANGVYLYRVLAKKADGSDFDLFENTAVDGFFKHGLGKMVLMR